MAQEPAPKRVCVDQTSVTDGGVECRTKALATAKTELGLQDSITHCIEIYDWGADTNCKDTFYSNIDKFPTVDFGAGGSFQVRLTRYGSGELEAAEDRGDYDMAPLELQLLTKRAGVNTDSREEQQNLPPHFKLLGYRLTDSSRTDADTYVELLDTLNEKRIRDADYTESALPPTIALSFTLPGRLARCEDAGVSHDLLQKRVDAFRQSDQALHLAILVPAPEKRLRVNMDGGQTVDIVPDDSSSSSSSSSENEVQ